MLTPEVKSCMNQSLQTARGSVSLAIKILEKLPEKPSNEKTRQEFGNLILQMGDAGKELRQTLHLMEVTILPMLEYRKPSILDQLKRTYWLKKMTKK